MFKRFLKYYWNAVTRYQVHSPFVFEWADDVLDDYRYYYAFDKAESARIFLEDNNEIITVTDFGAGSRVAKGNQRSIASIAKSAVTGERQCELLFKTIQRYKPKTMIEIGTSLGLAAVYQARGYENGHLWTLEGCPNIARIAQRTLLRCNVGNATVVTGEFGTTLQPTLQKIKQLDYIFIDGNHRYEPTLQYFNAALEFSHNNTLFIFDDIHWSDEMEKAWESVKSHPQVTLTIDLFHMGLVWIRKENKTPEHFTLIETRFKPWLKWKIF